VLLGMAWPRPRVLRVSAVELVDARGDVVGRLGVRDGGAELVLGGRAQASLVTDSELAALNLSGGQRTVRLVASDTCASDLTVVGDDEVGPPE
jgi:hypothetical protein